MNDWIARAQRRQAKDGYAPFVVRPGWRVDRRRERRLRWSAFCGAAAALVALGLVAFVGAVWAISAWPAQ